MGFVTGVVKFQEALQRLLNSKESGSFEVRNNYFHGYSYNDAFRRLSKFEAR